jgi:hypothetical protein
MRYDRGAESHGNLCLRATTQPGRACPAKALGRPGPEPNKKSFWYPDFTNCPDQKSIGLNPGDSANPDTAKMCLLKLL